MKIIFSSILTFLLAFAPSCVFGEHKAEDKKEEAKEEKDVKHMKMKKTEEKKEEKK